MARSPYLRFEQDIKPLMLDLQWLTASELTRKLSRMIPIEAAYQFAQTNGPKTLLLDKQALIRWGTRHTILASLKKLARKGLLEIKGDSAERQFRLISQPDTTHVSKSGGKSKRKQTYTAPHYQKAAEAIFNTISDVWTPTNAMVKLIGPFVDAEFAIRRYKAKAKHEKDRETMVQNGQRNVARKILLDFTVNGTLERSGPKGDHQYRLAQSI